MDGDGQKPLILNRPMQVVKARWDGPVQTGAMIRKTMKKQAV